MLAPGPNGNVLENSTGLIVSAQHGARRVVRRKASTLEITDVLSCSYGGLPLNGPNELAVHPRDGSIYFTDPFDGFLEIGKRPLGDHNYTSDKSALGFAGVYRVPPPPRVGAADAARPELVTAVLERPSGIGFEPAGTSAEGADDEHAMWVSECCQGHAESCPPATARWHRYVPVDGKPHANYTRERTVEWARPGGGGGCAGGFTLLARPQRSTLLVGACPLGVCVVDVERDDHAMVEYVEFPHRTTNVALAPGDHHLYVTGEGHLWRLPLAKDLFERPSHLPYLKEYKRVWQEAEQRWASALDNGLALTPPLGWSTWETCGDSKCSHDACTEAEVKDVARSMIENGLRDAGWTYVNLDDCWTGWNRTDNNNSITWDDTRFPSGIPALTAWLHERGFKFGLYTSGGTTTCIGRPGSRGYYEQDAAAFASWGVDYVKFDWCGDIKKEVWLGAKAHREFAQAMNATGRPMVLEVVAGYFFLWGEISKYANLWRFCEDHHDTWKSTSEALLCRHAMNASHTGGPGGWSSMDLMTTGGAGCLLKRPGAISDHCPGQSESAYTTEFVLWALTQSPMLVATDVRNMTSIMKSLMLNHELLGMHQSTATPPGRLLGHVGCGSELFQCTVWGRPMNAEGSEWVVALVNMASKHPHDLVVDWHMLGWPANASRRVRDVLLHRDLPDATGMLRVTGLGPHATAAFRLW